jgi:DNA-binding response OmpR family regulator
MHASTDSHERRLRALVLEADDAAVRAVRRSLEQAGFEVLCARDGAAGLDLLLDELLHLDVVVADLDLPVRDARALARLVRGAGGEQDLALVVPGRAVTPRLRAELFAAGVDAVVDRSEGPRAVAAAALTAIAARTGSGDPAMPRASVTARIGAWTAAALAGWSPAAA